MEIEATSINCATDDFGCVRYSFRRGEDDELLDRLEEHARSLADDVNPAQANTSQRRGSERKIKDNIVGLVAEFAWEHWINNQLDKNVADYEFIEKNWDSPEEQIDLILDIDGRQITFEVRASCTYAGIEPAVCEHFDIIGWYKNSIKQGEKPKDYYLRSVFDHDPENILDELDRNGLDVYLTGGASESMLEESQYAVTDNMDAGGGVDADGEYRLIRPISNGLDINELVDELL
jgi:hypothetical protein